MFSRAERDHMRLVLDCLHFVLAAASMVMSTQFTEQNEAFHEDGGWTGDWSTVDAAMSSGSDSASLTNPLPPSSPPLACHHPR